MGKSSLNSPLEVSSLLPSPVDDCFDGLCQWNSCAGQTLTFANEMCNPPSWKSSEGEDVDGDHSVWDSEEDSADCSPGPDSKFHSFSFSLSMVKSKNEMVLVMVDQKGMGGKWRSWV